MGQRISRRWLAVREEITARGKAEPQIRYDEFSGVCKRHGVIGQEALTLAQLLHDLGYIIYYGEDEGLREIVVLNPEWLTKAISYVLEDTATKDAGGVLEHARLKEIWQNRADGPAYPAYYHPYFLRLMEKFDVSYRLEGELRSLVAQLAPFERPALPWQLRTRPPMGVRTLSLVCRLSEPAPGLIPWLTVRHHRASTGLHWRRGVFLRYPISTYSSEALMELDNPTELSLEVRAPSPDLYFNVLRDSIEDLIGARWPGLTYRLLIPCPRQAADGSMCSGLFPLDGLLRVRETGKTATVPCMDCAQVHEIAMLLTGFTVREQPLAEGLAQMRDQMTRLERDVKDVQAEAADIAQSIRRVLQVVSAEVTDCPRLFTFVPVQPTGPKRLRVDEDHYRLTLWCEQPGYWHPWSQASYELDLPRSWIAEISPYAHLIVRTLQLLVPPAGAVADALLPSKQLASTATDIQLMTNLVADLANAPDQAYGMADLGLPSGRLTAAEGQALRAVRAVLFERDRSRAFGGLRRVQGPSGDFIWVCEDHYPEYDPGLPAIS